jgi:hypothetical protein
MEAAMEMAAKQDANRVRRASIMADLRIENGNQELRPLVTRSALMSSSGVALASEVGQCRSDA